MITNAIKNTLKASARAQARVDGMVKLTACIRHSVGPWSAGSASRGVWRLLYLNLDKISTLLSVMEKNRYYRITWVNTQVECTSTRHILSDVKADKVFALPLINAGVPAGRCSLSSYQCDQ